MKTTDFAKRMKIYEKSSTSYKLIPNLPVIARIDGKAFHTFCKYFDKPFDKGLMSAMISTTKFLVEKTNALIGYTQSDEITLIWDNNYHSPMIFDGKLYKLNSVIASMATGYFNSSLHDYMTHYLSRSDIAFFDCRVWNVPSEIEACNVLLWREQDAVRNSIQSLGQAIFSHKQLHKKSCAMIQDMLHEKGINWNDLTSAEKRGTYVKRILEERILSIDEISKLPEKHEARNNPELLVKRHKIIELEMPPFQQVVNKVDVVFKNGVPILF
jgi:tRNA(His) 5'-end guanylyltransferase